MRNLASGLLALVILLPLSIAPTPMAHGAVAGAESASSLPAPRQCEVPIYRALARFWDRYRDGLFADLGDLLEFSASYRIDDNGWLTEPEISQDSMAYAVRALREPFYAVLSYARSRGAMNFSDFAIAGVDRVEVVITLDPGGIVAQGLFVDDDGEVAPEVVEYAEALQIVGESYAADARARGVKGLVEIFLANLVVVQEGRDMVGLQSAVPMSQLSPVFGSLSSWNEAHADTPIRDFPPC